MTLAELRRTLQEHAEDLRALHVESLAAFGSVARGDAREDSDIDLLIEFDEPVGLFHFSRVKRRLEEILKRRVDLVTRGALHPALRDRILGESVRAS